jgi:cytochrome c oxidase assembly protein subunit 15
MHIQVAQDLMPSGPVTHGKAWVEMVHRYLATGVGGLIVVLCVLAWRQRRSGDARIKVGLPMFTLFWVCLQGAFGALTVTMKLFPAIVTLHLLGGVILLALLVFQAARMLAPVHIADQARLGLLRTILVTTGVLLMMQIALGGWVSTNYAVLACDSFPACQGSYWPDMAFAEGFELWRPLGHTALGELLSFQALTAIHYVHRLVAYAVIVCLLGLVWLLNQHLLRLESRALLGLVTLQFLTGLSNVVLGWPMPAAILHTGGAAAMMALIVLAWQRTRLQPTMNVAA